MKPEVLPQSAHHQVDLGVAGLYQQWPQIEKDRVWWSDLCGCGHALQPCVAQISQDPAVQAVEQADGVLHHPLDWQLVAESASGDGSPRIRPSTLEP